MEGVSRIRMRRKTLLVQARIRRYQVSSCAVVSQLMIDSDRRVARQFIPRLPGRGNDYDAVMCSSDLGCDSQEINQIMQ